ncbi:MAG: hypothetical protein LBC41_05025, partial [Clostridiales bacterium]|nr:hypothetical protein [Clostridiales bacterium]
MKSLLLVLLLILLAGCGQSSLPPQDVETLAAEAASPTPSETPTPSPLPSPSPSPTLTPTPTPTPSETPTPTPTPSPTEAPQMGILTASSVKEIKTLDTVFTYNGFLDIEELDPTIIIDSRYATTNNFAGKVFHPFPLALVRKEVAEMLLEAQEVALDLGYKIRIYDAYRPLFVQRQLFEA